MHAAVAAQERRKETPAQRLVRETVSFAASLLRLLVLAAVLTPVLLFSFLTVDIQIFRFDRMFDAALLKPSNWLSIGGLAITAAAPIAILATRKFGGDEASRAVTASWGIAAIATFAELSLLAPAIETSDLPSARFVVAFVASAMIGQYLAIAMYDVTRGGGAWWRAPLIAAMTGFGAHTLVYFPAAYWGVEAPWFNWMVSDYALKAVVAVAFLPIYWLLQKPLRPVGGYGGR